MLGVCWSVVDDRHVILREFGQRTEGQEHLLTWRTFAILKDERLRAGLLLLHLGLILSTKSIAYRLTGPMANFLGACLWLNCRLLI